MRPNRYQEKQFAAIWLFLITQEAKFSVKLIRHSEIAREQHLFTRFECVGHRFTDAHAATAMPIVASCDFLEPIDSALEWRDDQCAAIDGGSADITFHLTFSNALPASIAIGSSSM